MKFTRTTGEPRTLPTPLQIVEHLDRFIRGQARAKQDLAVSVYNHYMAQRMRDLYDTDLGNYHTLLLGPTGSGKTAMVKVLSEFLEVPVSFVSATSLVEAGFRGRSVDDIVKSLLDRANGNSRLAERGILFIDEIDKIRRQDTGGSRDVSGEGVQNALLTMLDGRLADNVDGVRHEPVDTSRILFICTGAFVGLQAIIEQRIASSETQSNRRSRRIGFTSRVNENLETIPNQPIYTALCNATTKDLIDFGLTPEFIGRFANITTLHELGREDLIAILSEGVENSALARRKRMAELHGIELEISKEALEMIADEALRLSTGARGLHRLMDKAIDSVDYRLPELADSGVTKITIDTDCITNSGQPKLKRGKRKSERIDQIIREDCLRTLPNPPKNGGASSTQSFPCPSGQTFTDTTGWTDKRIRDHIESVKQNYLDWEGAIPNAVKWWNAFEFDNEEKPNLILRLAEELKNRNATINDFFLAYLYSKCDGIRANLHYLVPRIRIGLD
jgi:ATP-dependent Clp protease ATP-binding subunit ClpX